MPKSGVAKANKFENPKQNKPEKTFVAQNLAGKRAI